MAKIAATLTLGLDRLGNFDEAIKYYKMAAKENRFSEAPLYLADVLARSGDEQAAIKQYKKLRKEGVANTRVVKAAEKGVIEDVPEPFWTISFDNSKDAKQQCEELYEKGIISEEMLEKAQGWIKYKPARW